MKVKTKLLQETLENKNRDLDTLESFKRNNEQLLVLLERYDHKVIEMQTEIDVRELRIKELEEKEEPDKILNLDDLEERIKFLIALLERCRNQLEREADKENGLNEDLHERLEYHYRNNREISQTTSELDTMVREIRHALNERYRYQSEKHVFPIESLL